MRVKYFHPYIEPVIFGALWNLENRLEELEIRGRIETIQITALLKLAKIIIRDLRRLIVTQTPVNNHQLSLM